MFCKYCGEEITEGAKYCSSCGQPVDNNIDIDFTKKEEGPVVDTGPYKVFAIIGYVYGFASLAFCWCPYMFFAMIPGIVLACLGTNSKDETKRNQAATGRTLTIIATAINVILTIAFTVFWIAFAFDMARQN